MKITKDYLKKLILEELSTEAAMPADEMPFLNMDSNGIIQHIESQLDSLNAGNAKIDIMAAVRFLKTKTEEEVTNQLLKKQ